MNEELMNKEDFISTIKVTPPNLPNYTEQPSGTGESRTAGGRE